MYGKYKRQILVVSYMVISVALFYLFFTYVIGLIAPFVIAWILAMLLNPIVSFWERKVKGWRGIITIITMVFMLMSAGTIIFILARRLFKEIIELSSYLPIIQENTEIFFMSMEKQFSSITRNMPLPESFSTLSGIVQELLNYIGQILKGLMGVVYSVITSVPNGILIFVMIMLSTYFMTRDYEIIKKCVTDFVPYGLKQKGKLINKSLRNALGGYIRTQIILMCYTFGICIVGLAVLGRKYFFLISIAIACVDALPVLGSGLILITWAVYQFIVGEVAIGVGLLCIYGVIVVMRQIMEPKVLSTQIGVYPLITLGSIYIGIKLIGVMGIIIGPVVAVVLQSLYEAGIFSGFINKQNDRDIV